MAFFPHESNPTSAPPAGKLSQYDNENPIIHEQTINDKSKGLENIASKLGGVSEMLAKRAENLGAEESNAMYAQSQAHLDTAKTNAKIDMIKNPGQASKILEQTTEAYSSITSDAIVNKGDRIRLNLSASNDLNDLRVDAARSELEVNKHKSTINFYSQFPTLLSGIVESVGNEKEWNNRVNSASTLINSMVSIGALTPEQTGHAMQALKGAIDRSQAFLRAAGGSAPMSAKQYHQMKGGLIPVDDGTHMGQPVDHNTAHLYSSQVDDLSFQTLKSNVAEGGAGSPLAWSKLKDTQFQEIIAYSNGSHSAYADLKAGTPFPQLQVEYTTLSNKGNLTTTEQGRLDAIHHIVNSGAAGFADNLISENPLYKGAVAQYNQVIAAINEDGGIDPSRKAALTQSYDNDLAWKKLSIQESMHFPTEMMQPLDRSFTDATKSAWIKPDADPSPLITRLDYMQAPALKEGIAKAQDTPVRQEAARVVGNLKGATWTTHQGGITTLAFGWQMPVTVQDRMLPILANQPNRDYSNLKDAPSDKKLSVDIATKLSDQTLFLSSQAGGTQRAAALGQMGLNMVKYLAQQSGDFSMSNKDAYVDKVTGILRAAYKVQAGTNWMVNKNDVPVEGINNWQMDVISNHLIEQVKDNLRIGDARGLLDAAIDQNGLRVVSTPESHLKVIDAHGTAYLDVRFSNSLLHYATHVMLTKEQEEAKRLTESIPNKNVPGNPQDADTAKEMIDDDIKETEKLRQKGEKKAKRQKKEFVEEKAKYEAEHGQ